MYTIVPGCHPARKLPASVEDRLNCEALLTQPGFSASLFLLQPCSSSYSCSGLLALRASARPPPLAGRTRQARPAQADDTGPRGRAGPRDAARRFVITSAVRPPGEDADVPTFCRALGVPGWRTCTCISCRPALEVGALHQLAASNWLPPANRSGLGSVATLWRISGRTGLHLRPGTRRLLLSCSHRIRSRGRPAQCPR